MKKLIIAAAIVPLLAACNGPKALEWIESDPENSWKSMDVKKVRITNAGGEKAMATLSIADTAQAVDGFGACFNELGWTSLSKLSSEDRAAVLDELFVPGKGANFNICRLPVGANDFAREWYSYDETPGDFEMNDFSIQNDMETIVPFIKEALKRNPDIKLWASPWSPPTWMKRNGHYACSGLSERARQFFKDAIDTGIRPDQYGHEGSDMFIMEEPYLKAYALYFSKFIQAYRDCGIDISMVMPQNEFNSCQPYAACTWTTASLAEFMGRYLGPEMEKLGVEMYFGTMERPNTAMVDTVMNDPMCKKYVKGAAFQWAGKDALPYTRDNYPGLKLMQSEQECGNGKNDWEGCLHSWDLLKFYFNGGVSIYEYWNISLEKGMPSAWGWRQNSLVSVNEDGTYNLTYEYYLLKHASHFVKPGARFIPVKGEYDDMLAFRNPDGTLVLILHNGDYSEAEKTVAVDGKVISAVLPAGSFSTLTVKI